MSRIRFAPDVKRSNGVYDGSTWRGGNTPVPSRQVPPASIDPADLESSIWWKAMASDARAKASPYARLWERDEAYLDDPSLFHVRHRVDPSAVPDLADVRIPAYRGAPGKSSVRRPRPVTPSPTPEAAPGDFDNLLNFMTKLNIKLGPRIR